MSVKIRLRRVGAKNQPAYRVVIADARAPRDGRFIEIIGHYNPLTHPSTVVIDGERALYWLKRGAQPTDVVRGMLDRQGVMAQFTGAPAPEPVIAPEPVKPSKAKAAPVAEVVAVEEAAPAVEEAPVAEVAVEDAPAVEAAPAIDETPASDAAPTDDEKVETPAE